MLGLSLAGTQATGAAAADEGTRTDTATVSAGPTAPSAGTTPEAPSSASPARRAGRSARSVVTSSSSRATEWAVPAPAAATGPPLSVIAEARQGTAALAGQASNTRSNARQRSSTATAAGETPARSFSSAIRAIPDVPAVLMSASPQSAAVVVAPSRAVARGAIAREAIAMGTPPSRQSLRALATTFLDSAVNWLRGFPTNPITDFLAGALWQVRKTLTPSGVHVLVGGSTACVATRNCKQQDLEGVNLTGANLSYVDFRYSNLSSAILNGANLTEADLTGSVNLNYTQLVKSNLQSAKLNDASLRGADLTGAVLKYAYLSGADLTGAVLNNADLTAARVFGWILFGATLTGANMTQVDFGRTDLRGKDLTGVNLTGAYLAEAYLNGANLTGANLTGAKLTGADLTGANLTGATCPNGQIYGSGGDC